MRVTIGSYYLGVDTFKGGKFSQTMVVVSCHIFELLNYITICQLFGGIMKLRTVVLFNFIGYPKVGKTLQTQLFGQPQLLTNLGYLAALFHHPFVVHYNVTKYSSNKIRKTQNEHPNIICQNLNSQ